MLDPRLKYETQREPDAKVATSLFAKQGLLLQVWSPQQELKIFYVNNLKRELYMQSSHLTVQIQSSSHLRVGPKAHHSSFDDDQLM